MFAPRGLISIRTVVKEFLRDRRVEADDSDEEDLEIHDPEAVNPSGGQEK
jgi:hypothetical protein